MKEVVTLCAIRYSKYFPKIAAVLLIFMSVGIVVGIMSCIKTSKILAVQDCHMITSS